MLARKHRFQLEILPDKDFWPTLYRSGGSKEFIDILLKDTINVQVDFLCARFKTFICFQT